MRIMGVDPGLDGGLAIIEDNGKPFFYRSMPTKKIVESSGKKKRMIDISQFSAIIARAEPEHVFIEKVHAMPGQGVTSMFNFGMGYGMLLGICLALEPVFRTELVTPQSWQKLLYANHTFPDDYGPKHKAFMRFSDIWPELVEQNVTHDGVVDALLIAEYGRRILNLN